MELFYPYATLWSRVNAVYPKPPNLFSIGTVFSDEQGKWLELSTKIKWFCPSSGETLVVHPGVVVKVDGSKDESRVVRVAGDGLHFPVCKTWQIWTDRYNFASFDSTGLRECELITFAKRKGVLDPFDIDDLKKELGCKILSKLLYENQPS